MKLISNAVPNDDGPLNRHKHWTFILRPAPGDKFDLIVLHAAEGTYQLKRVTRDKLASFDIASASIPRPSLPCSRPEPLNF